MKIAIVGCSGSGKSTLATKLGRQLQIPHIELDALFHQTNWVPKESGPFREEVKAVMQQMQQWIIDGNYQSKLEEIVITEADLVIFFNLSRRLVMYRIIKRTILRLLLRKELWNENREKFGNLLNLSPEENVILWSWTQHSAYREWGLLKMRTKPSHQIWIEVKRANQSGKVLAALMAEMGLRN